MTTKTNWRAHPSADSLPLEETQSTAAAAPHSALDWRVGQARRALPSHMRRIMSLYFDWAKGAWREAYRHPDLPRRDLPPLNPGSAGWMAFLCGGAHSFARRYAIPVERLPQFVAITYYLQGCTLEDAYATEDRVRDALMRQVPILIGIRGAGTEHAAWWIETHKDDAPELQQFWAHNAATTYDAPEPARFFDLACAHRLGLQAALH